MSIARTRAHTTIAYTHTHTVVHIRVHLPLPRQLHSQCKIPFTGHTRGHWHLSGLHSFAIQISLNHSPALSSYSLSVWFSCSLEVHTNTNMQAHIMLCLCNLLARQLSNEAVNAIYACKSVITLTVCMCVCVWVRESDYLIASCTIVCLIWQANAWGNFTRLHSTYLNTLKHWNQAQ